jgi:hypothetical protein
MFIRAYQVGDCGNYQKNADPENPWIDLQTTIHHNDCRKAIAHDPIHIHLPLRIALPHKVVDACFLL